jgi:hypothetical protein
MGRPVTAGITDAQRDALAMLSPALDAETYLAGDVAIALELNDRLGRIPDTCLFARDKMRAIPACGRSSRRSAATRTEQNGGDLGAARRSRTEPKSQHTITDAPRPSTQTPRGGLLFWLLRCSDGDERRATSDGGA